MLVSIYMKSHEDILNYYPTRYIQGNGTVYSYFMTVWGIVKTAAPRCRGQLDALLPEAERPRAMVHRAIHGTAGQ